MTGTPTSVSSKSGPRQNLYPGITVVEGGGEIFAVSSRGPTVFFTLVQTLT